MANSIILKCTCDSEFQDQQYGLGMRLHTVRQVKGKTLDKAYCTVCSPKNNPTMALSEVKENKLYGMVVSQDGKPNRKSKSI